MMTHRTTILLALAALLSTTLGAARGRADTVSPAVGWLRGQVTGPVTVAVSSPFLPPDDAPAGDGTAAQLLADSTGGDQLHIWTGASFNAYTLADGAWRIYGTDAPMPATRLKNEPGHGCLLTRTTPEPTRVQVWGELNGNSMLTVSVPASAWRLIGYPYPADTTLADLTAAGVETGDEVKRWDAGARAWVTHALADGVWSGGDATVIPAGTPFLFHNGAAAPKTLTFNRMY